MTVSAFFAMDAAVLASLIESAQPSLNAPDPAGEDSGPFASLVEERLFEESPAGKADVPEPGTGTAPARFRKPGARAEKLNFAPEYFFPAASFPIEPPSAQAPPRGNPQSGIPEPAEPVVIEGGSEALCASLDTAETPPSREGAFLTFRNEGKLFPPRETAERAAHTRNSVQPADFERPDRTERRLRRQIEADGKGEHAATLEPVCGTRMEVKEPAAPQSGPPPETRPAPGLPLVAEPRLSRPREAAAAVRPPAVPSAKEPGKTGAAPGLGASGPSEERTSREPMGTVEAPAPVLRDEPRRRETAPEAAASGDPHPDVPVPAKAEAIRTETPARPRLNPQLRMEPVPAPAAGSAPAPPRAVRIELPLGEEGAVRAKIVATPAAVQVTMRATDPGVQAEIHRYAPQLQSRLEEMQRPVEPVRDNWESPAYEAASAANGVSPESFAGAEGDAGGTGYPLPGEDREGGFGHRRHRRQAEQEEEDNR